MLYRVPCSHLGGPGDCVVLCGLGSGASSEESEGARHSDPKVETETTKNIVNSILMTSCIYWSEIETESIVKPWEKQGYIFKGHVSRQGKGTHIANISST